MIRERILCRVKPAKCGFTLFEVLAVIAIIGLLSGLLVFDFGGFAARSQPNDYDSLMAAVECARIESETRDVEIRHDEDQKALVISSAGAELKKFPISRHVTFLLPKDESASGTRQLDHLTFSSAGDATPALILLRTRDGDDIPYRIEPFSRAVSRDTP